MDSKKTITNEIFGSVSGSGGGTSSSTAFAFSEQLITTTTFPANAISDVATDKQFTISLYKLGNIVFCRIKRVVTTMSSVQFWEIDAPIRASLQPATKTTHVFLPMVDIESFDSDIMGAVTVSTNGNIEILREKLVGSGSWDGSACGWDDICMYWLVV